MLGAEYAKLVDDVREGRESVLDEYGATDPAEFFAVATEAFFERPSELRARQPDLYDQLKDYYNVDPAEWIKCPAS